MKVQMLNTIKVDSRIDEMGLKKNFVIKKLGISPTAGNNLLTHGLLPRDAKKSEELLLKLSEILATPVGELLTTLVEERVKKAA